MKKLLLLFAVFICSSSFAQNEVKVDIGDALVIKTLELGYENYVIEQTSVGISALFNFEKESADFKYNENTMITPFVRHYFSVDKSWNPFGELFLAYNSGKNIEETLGVTTEQRYSDGALGVAAGYKYISPGGFTVDFHAGVGRNLFNNDSPSVVPRVGVNIGWQF